MFVCDKCTIISKMQNMYKYTNYIFCINRVLHVNHTLFYRKFKKYQKVYRTSFMRNDKIINFTQTVGMTRFNKNGFQGENNL